MEHLEESIRALKEMFIERKPVIEVRENHERKKNTLIALTTITIGLSQFCLIEGSLGLPGGIPH